MPNREIIDSIWFTEMGSYKPVGIILIKDKNSGIEKAYIGTGEGRDRKADEKWLMRRGAKFPIEAAKMLMGK